MRFILSLLFIVIVLTWISTFLYKYIAKFLGREIKRMDRNLTIDKKINIKEEKDIK